MMHYIDNHLLSAEKIILRTKPSWIGYVSPLIMLCCSVALFFLLSTMKEVSYAIAFASIIYLLSVWFTVTFSEFVVTDKRVIVKRGLFNVATVVLLLKKIESIDCYQNFSGRLFDYGTVTIIGSGGTHDRLFNISKPAEFRDAIQNAIGE